MKYQYPNLEAIPEPLRTEYEEREGAFVLRVEELPEGFVIENLSGLKNALKAERANNKTLGAALAELQGGNATDQKKLAGKVDQLSTQNEKLLSELNAQRLTNCTTEAIVEAKGNPALLRPLLERRLKIDENGKPLVVDESGQPLLAKDGTPVSVRDFVFALKTLPAYQGAFAGTGSSGGGAPPSSGNGGTTSTPQRRSQMDVRAKAAYIREHGTERFMQLPQ